MFGLFLCSVMAQIVTGGWSYYEDEGVCFKICKHLKMTLYSQNNPISHFKRMVGVTRKLIGHKAFVRSSRKSEVYERIKANLSVLALGT